jgi:hypothetical protein
LSRIIVVLARAKKGQPPQRRFRMYYQIRLDGKNIKVAFYNAAMARNRAQGKTRYGTLEKKFTADLLRREDVHYPMNFPKFIQYIQYIGE